MIHNYDKKMKEMFKNVSLREGFKVGDTVKVKKTGETGEVVEIKHSGNMVQFDDGEMEAYTDNELLKI